MLGKRITDGLKRFGKGLAFVLKAIFGVGGR
jgi:hypothetical protein